MALPTVSESLSEVDDASAPNAPLNARPRPQSRDPRPGGGHIRRLLHDRSAVLAGGFLTVVLVAAIFAPLIAPHDPTEQNLAPPFSGPGWGHLLGTDDIGRDILSRLIYASRLSMLASISTVALALCIALPVGLWAGYAGGWVDTVLMRIMDAGLSFPPLVLALSVAGVLGPGMDKLVFALAVVFAPSLARLIRGQALAIKEETFVEASKTIGTSTRRILVHRVLPNLRNPLMVSVSFALAAALLAEAALSYLGLGAQPPEASWGNMLRRGYDKALFTDPWQLIIPGLAIALTVLAITTLSDSLRDSLGGASSIAANRRSVRRGMTKVRRKAQDAAGSARRVKTSATPDAADMSPIESSTVLNVEGLAVEFGPNGSAVEVLDDVSFPVGRGQIVGLVGESGSGKTVTSLSIMQLLPSPPGQITSGRIMWRDEDILGMSFEELRQIRGNDIAMVFQDPMTSLDPAFTVGSQIIEAILLHEDVTRIAARDRAVEMLDLVGIPAARQRISDYPHQLSGGMRQRVVIAMALACRPRLLIADEPTTALDVTIQAQILDLFRSLQEELDFSVVFVTHDLGVVADVCQQVVVMYAGQVVEEASVDELFSRPAHPYTEGLLKAMPQVGRRDERLTVIPGTVPAMNALPPGCRFSARCPYATDKCRSDPIPLVTLRSGRRVRCIRHDELNLEGSV